MALFAGENDELPLRPIPGGYGLPLLGAFKDRLDYFWFQGPETFFRSRMELHKSTVFRTNIPPTFPFFFGTNPNLVAVLDVESFSHLLDSSLVDKKNVLVGDFTPSTSFTGGHRVLAYLDTDEPLHASAKRFVIDTLHRSSQLWESEFLKEVDVMFDTLEEKLAGGGGEAELLGPLRECLFSFLCKSLMRADPQSAGKKKGWGPSMVLAWLALQIMPIKYIDGVPQPLAEIFLYSFPYPAFLTKWAYNSLYSFIESEAKFMVSRGVDEYGLTKSESINNLMFMLGFNAFGGFGIFFPKLLFTVANLPAPVRSRLIDEARKPKTLTFETARDMELVKSIVYETLRLNPPVPQQFGRARRDMKLKSHDSCFDIKKGELLCGYQPLVMRDPKVFEKGDEFVAERFMGEKGKELLKYLFWSNGPQTATPAPENKQCPGKEYVVETGFLLVAAVFRRYDEFMVNEKKGMVTGVKRANLI